MGVRTDEGRSAGAGGPTRLLSAPHLALTSATFALLALGVVASAAGRTDWARWPWAVAALVAVPPALWWVVQALRQRRLGVDLVAVLALAGALAVGEPLAGALIAVMLTGGRALEAAARRRARRDLQGLVDRAPRVARRRVGGTVQELPVADVVVGDVVVVAPGEVLPVDGTVVGAAAVLDESALTGEAGPVDRAEGQDVRSGTVNAGGVLEVRCTVPAARGTYAGIVELAGRADAQDAPVVRVADRVAAWFLPTALVVAAAGWVLGGPVRAVAVLVVATPCPLLLAAPVAVVSGLARTSRRGVVVREGAALETLGRARTVVLDKTGTLTAGRPTVREVVVAPDRTVEEVLRLAASLDQESRHVLAATVVAAARDRGLPLTRAHDVHEEPGRGVRGTVDGVALAVGRHDERPPGGALEPAWAAAVADRATRDACSLVWVDVDGAPAGLLVLSDPLRPDAARTLRRLRAAGVERIVLLTGDRPEPAREVGDVLGLDEVRSRQSPVDKVEAVRRERELAVTVAVGDGINDAPALAAASVGVALGARGATATAAAADVVLLADRIDRLADSMEIARYARRTAVQSAVAGTGLSLVAMVAAVAGFVPPAPGALLQEGIDVAVILYALRVLRGGRTGSPPLPEQTRLTVRRFAAERAWLPSALAEVRGAADVLVEVAAGDCTPDTVTALRRAAQVLSERIVPTERAQERELYPELARSVRDPEALAPVVRVHADIARLSRRVREEVERVVPGAPLGVEQRRALLTALYGVHALLVLHQAQEGELFDMADDTAVGGSAIGVSEAGVEEVRGG